MIMKPFKFVWKVLWCIPTYTALLVFVISLMCLLGPKVASILIKDWGDSWSKFKRS